MGRIAFHKKNKSLAYVRISKNNLAYLSIKEMLSDKWSTNEFHFFFNRVKGLVGALGGYEKYNLEDYCKSGNRNGLLDNIPESFMFVDNNHPWRRDWKVPKK